MNIIDTAKARYSTKVFDPSQKLDEQKLIAIKELLRLAPSSVNGQPWHFIIAGSEEGKARIVKAVQGPYSFNLEKIRDASHVVVFCARTKMDEAFLQKLTDQEDADGRFPSTEAKDDMHERRSFYVNMHANTMRDLPEWTARQVYLNLGAFLLGAGALGIDAVPIEGFDRQVIIDEFDLEAKGMTGVVLAAIGSRSADDFNAPLPKSRLPLEDVIEEI